MNMNIRTKLTYGIGFLFVMIVLLGGLAIKNINDISFDTQNILADNYNSLLYSRRMLESLEIIKDNPEAKKEFEASLGKQQENITEFNEDVLTSNLNSCYENMLKQNMDDESIRQTRKAIYSIMGANMSAIYDKNKVAIHTAEDSLLWIWIVGIICIAIAFLFLIRLPYSVNIQIKKLTDGIKEITKANYSKRLDLGNEPEFKETAILFNEMAERLAEYRNSSLENILQGKKYIETLINSIAEPIIGLDKERKILFVNDEALTVLNISRENIIDKPAPELALKNDLLRRLIRQLVHPNENKDPLKIYADNKESYFQVKYIPINVNKQNGLESKYVGDVILLKNVTEFKERDIAKTTFISTISHELKTPISAIMMSLKLLEDKNIGELNPEQETLSQKIKENSDRLLEITGELLKMSQVESGKLYLNPKITKPIELINYAIKANRVQAERFNCQIEVEYPEKIAKLFVDSEKIAWVVTNLLSNAIRYSSENGRVIIGARQDSNAIEIYVKDFGKGIDPRYHESIFDHYFRVPGTKMQGSGLGLAISKDFVEAHGGTIHIESELGKGSTFVIRFNI
ncbi:ATP-binding protein [uncultured Parabacteroides sp.]|uniref:ATP-binding protein n=1 Tax=uncultured Parabacteroides sp. TaxID=512312 RepID=UPI0026321F37|nr:ATP-binding protein [uncultured Parabacteroides sp.]